MCGSLVAARRSGWGDVKRYVVVVLLVVASPLGGALTGWAVGMAVGPHPDDLMAATRSVLSEDMTVTHDARSTSPGPLPAVPPWFGYWQHSVEATAEGMDHDEAWQDVSTRLREAGWYPFGRTNSWPAGTALTFWRGDIRMSVSVEGQAPSLITATARPNHVPDERAGTGLRVGASGGAVLGFAAAVVALAHGRRRDAGDATQRVR